MTKEIYQKEMKRVVSRLKKKYRPEKIILFGSGLGGKLKSDSDLDFFVVKKTKKPLPKRIQEIDGLLLDRKIPLDFLVYTPTEVNRRLSLGDQFIQGIITNGKTLYERNS